MKIKLLNEDAVVPTRGSKSAAGYDLYSAENSDIWIDKNSTFKIHIGIAIEIPEGYVGLIYARSGIATKNGIRPANCVGVIDSDYRGEIIVALHNDSNTSYCVKSHDRVAQLVIAPYIAPEIEIVDEISDTDRGDGGFGHTGK